MAGQVFVREKIGVDFATILPVVLRQDPDVILLGKICDIATAEAAFQAALTGHLVYSTPHINSTVATIARLFDLVLKPYVVATVLEGIIAQRLVRRICEDCRAPAEPDPPVRCRLGSLFDITSTVSFHDRDCPCCNNSSYRGCPALYEVMRNDGYATSSAQQRQHVGARESYGSAWHRQFVGRRTTQGARRADYAGRDTAGSGRAGVARIRRR